MSYKSINITDDEQIRWADDSRNSEDLEKQSISSDSEGSGSESDGRKFMRNKCLRDIWEEDLIWASLQSLPDADKIFELLKQDNLEAILMNEHALATGVLLAAHLGKSQILKELLAVGGSVQVTDISGRSPLHLAANRASLECIKLLIEHKANVNQLDITRKITPLHCAASKGNVQCLKYLIRAGADVNASLNSKTPVHYAVESNAVDCVRELLDNGANPNTLQVFSETPLHVAATVGSPEIIKLLLKKGASVNVQCGQDKSTALHFAAEDGNVESLKLLLDAGANISSLNYKNQTPLHIAALCQSIESIELLLKRGANPNYGDIDGRTPLHSAIVKVSRSSDCVRLLLSYGANVNQADLFGYTPLHLAALNEFSNCVLLLINYGGDVTARTNGGVSVLTFITRRTPDVIPRYITKFDNAIKLTDHEIGDVDCELKLDFKILVPSSSKGETELLLNFIEVGHREILKHPLCETFLFLKWRRIRRYFLFSLFYHALFVFLFTAYIQGVFLRDCKSNRKVTLALFAAPTRPDCAIPVWCTAIGHILITLNLMMLAKEVFQIAHSWSTYMRQWENWLQWLIILSVFCSVAPNSDDIRETMLSLQHHIAAIGIFLTWVELMMIVGRFPTFGLYIQMFTTVAVNFTKFLLAYLCLLIAFTLCFGVLFANYPSFRNIFSAFIKTVIMMSGELEFEDIFYQDDYKIVYAGTAHVMFLAFVLLVTVILTNLMVGLAVSDIQGLQQSAGLDRLVRQAELVAHLESMLFSRLLRCIPTKLLAFLYKHALLLQSQQHCALYIRPNDPREERIPKDLIKNVYELVVEKKSRLRHKRSIKEESRISNTCQNLMTRINSSNDYIYLGKVL